MSRSLEIHEDMNGDLSIWRDPYAWVDPFAEAEEWALKWACIKVAFERRTVELGAVSQLWESQNSRVDQLCDYITETKK